MIIELELDARNAGIAGSLSDRLGNSFLDARIERSGDDVILVQLVVGDEARQRVRSRDLHFLVDLARTDVKRAAEDRPGTPERC